MLVTDYLKAVDDGKTALIIAPTHAEGERLTDELRESAERARRIGEEREFMARKGTGWTGGAKRRRRAITSPAWWSSSARTSKASPRAIKRWSCSGGKDVLLQKRDGSQARACRRTARSVSRCTGRAICRRQGRPHPHHQKRHAKADRPGRGTKINNGDIFTVEGFTKEGDITP